MINLQQFCADESSLHMRCYEFIQTPFNYNGHTYATDGCLMIEVPFGEDCERPSGDDAPQVERVLAAAETGSDMRPVPSINSVDEFEPCEMCKGTGSLADCTDCQGYGCDEDENECKPCDGNGYISVPSEHPNGSECDGCHGLGKTRIQRSVRLAPNLIIQARYLNLIASLPNARLLFSPKSKDTPVSFYFDGGRGWVMQMRHDIEIDFDLTSGERCPHTEDMFS